MPFYSLQIPHLLLWIKCRSSWWEVSDCPPELWHSEMRVWGLSRKYLSILNTWKPVTWPWCNLAASQRRPYCTSVNSQFPVGLVSQQWDTIDQACVHIPFLMNWAYYYAIFPLMWCDLFLLYFWNKCVNDLEFFSLVNKLG